MDITKQKIEMMKAYSNAIDAFSCNENKKAYEEMMKASSIAKDLARVSHYLPDVKEYHTLADYYYRKAQTFIVKEANHIGSDVYQIEVPTQGFVDFIGLDDIKKNLEESLIKPWKNHTFYQREKSALLFYGPYGVGKTRFVHSLIKELEAKVYYFRPLKHFRLTDFPDVEYGYQQVFNEAEKQDGVIFFIESPVPFFSNGKDELSKDTTELFIRIFKREMKRIRRKKLNMLLIATTSVPDKLDQKALKKPLFDDFIKIPLPDENIRKGLVDRYLAAVEISEEDKDMLVKKTQGLVNKDITRLCKEILANDDYSSSGIEKVLKEFKPTDNKEYEESIHIFENHIQNIEK